MVSPSDKHTAEGLKMCLLALMTAHFAHRGYSAETRKEVADALVEAVAIRISLIASPEARLEAIMQHAEAVAEAAENRLIARVRDRQS